MLRKRHLQTGSRNDRISQRVRELQAEEEEAQRVFQRTKTSKEDGRPPNHAPQPSNHPKKHDVTSADTDDEYYYNDRDDDTASQTSAFSRRRPRDKCHRRKRRCYDEPFDCLPSCLPSVGCGGLPLYNYGSYGFGCGGFGWNLPPSFVTVPVPMPMPVCAVPSFGMCGPYIL